MSIIIKSRFFRARNKMILQYVWHPHPHYIIDVSVMHTVLVRACTLLRKNCHALSILLQIIRKAQMLKYVCAIHLKRHYNFGAVHAQVALCYKILTKKKWVFNFCLRNFIKKKWVFFILLIYIVLFTTRMCYNNIYIRYKQDTTYTFCPLMVMKRSCFMQTII